MEIKQEIQELGQGRISKLLFKFAFPCVMGLLISAFYNIVDQIFIGNSELGYLGNAATGVSFPVICIANAFAWCVGDGAAAFLSICAGRGDAARAHKCVGTSITASTIISILLAIIGLWGTASHGTFRCFCPDPGHGSGIFPDCGILLPGLSSDECDEQHDPG